MKKHKVKDKFLDILEKVPIIEAACGQAGISRNTYYRWRNEDPDFAALADERQTIGIERVNDYAESNVLNGIKSGDRGYTNIWLKARHHAYRRPFPKAIEAKEESDEAEIEKAKKEILEWQKGWEKIGVPRADRKYSTKEQEAMRKLRELLSKNDQKRKRDKDYF